MLLEVRDAQGSLVDCEMCHVGLRTTQLSGGQLCVNGRPLMLCGVNRHDHCPRRGKAVSWESMKLDACLIKAHSLNAVRTSHYPNDTAWYELCDAIGTGRAGPLDRTAPR